MPTFARLSDLLGTPITRLDAEAIRRAIDNRITEDEQLDWKRSPYPSGKGDEIAKDVAALANHLGGIIVLGVDEDDAARACAAIPFTDDFDDLHRQIRTACSARIRPYLHISVLDIPDNNTGRRFAAIVVPRSPSAPHAIEQGSEKQPAFPVRDATTTRWLHEAELATRYRDRFAARVDVATRARTVHAEGVARQRRTDDWWLTVACAPTQPGARPPGPDARLAEQTFLKTWQANRPALAPRMSSPLLDTPSTAVRRTIFTSHGWRGAATAGDNLHIELGHTGNGYIGQAVRSEANVSAQGGAATVWVSSDRMEWAMFTSLALLVDHALDTDATGELEVIAQLHPARSSAGMCVPNTDPGPGYGYYGNDESLAAGHLTPLTVTVPLGATRDYPSIARATYQLATDMLAELSIDEPRLFTPDGHHSDTVGTTLTGLRDWIANNITTSISDFLPQGEPAPGAGHESK
ncbi:ATP-binding protein [Gordonia sp. TBRC 11910]|uniref:ATP-binding protein n=1 Tax=Gordonia asplenii TaxID=2725283 RepID=A0A848KWL1_9ACTN|nr:ATP-binding protein [Gordonia asplenii]NMO02632.1 ATP-binding protein [Gordonia asplenii]